jgi:hypothetical protein
MPFGPELMHDLVYMYIEYMYVWNYDWTTLLVHFSAGPREGRMPSGALLARRLLRVG